MRLKLYLLVFLSVFLSMGLHAQQHRFDANNWRVLDQEKCDGSIDIEIIRYQGGHKWGNEKTIFLQFKNKSGSWEDLASIRHFFGPNNKYQARQEGSYNIQFGNRNPDQKYNYYAYTLRINDAPNPNERVAYRWIQKEDNDYLSDTKYITAYRPLAVNLQVRTSTVCGEINLSWDKPSNVEGDVDYFVYHRHVGDRTWYLKTIQKGLNYTDQVSHTSDRKSVV